MKLRKDLKLHLLGGTALAVFFLLVLLIPRWVGSGGMGIAIMFAAVVAGWVIEEYQRMRNQGTYDALDWACTAAPGVLLGFAVGVWEALK